MEEFLKKINDLHNRCLNKNIVTYTGFLTPTEKQIVLNNFGKSVKFLGGVNEAERVLAFFLPEYMDNIDESSYITAFKAVFSFRNLSHRDFLGALLSLGIDRKCIGDIYVFEKEAYFFTTKEISKYVKGNFDKVGRERIKLNEVAFYDVKIKEPEFKEIIFTVKSLRLDSVIAGSIKESREKSSLIIKNGDVLLNYIVCQNVSNPIKEGDVLSVKRYGKYVISKVGGNSRSGKIFVSLKKYI